MTGDSNVTEGPAPPDPGRAQAGGLAVEAQTRYRFIRRLLLQRCPPPARIVELGAAPGDQIVALSRAGYSAVAVDLGQAPDEWADAAEGRMRAMFRDAGVQLVEWDLEQAPYPLGDTEFDAVVFTEVFEHLRDYPIRSLKEAWRILKPGGILCLTTPNAAYLINRFRLLAGQNVASPLGDWIGGLVYARHAREYTVEEIRALLEQSGFVVELLTSRHFNIDVGNVSSPARVAKMGLDRLARIRPSLGPCTVAVGRRP